MNNTFIVTKVKNPTFDVILELRTIEIELKDEDYLSIIDLDVYYKSKEDLFYNMIFKVRSRIDSFLLLTRG